MTTHNPRYQTVAELATTDPEKFIQVKVMYNEGGINYWDYSKNSKGYYLHVTPITRAGRSLSFMVGSGCKSFIEEAERFNTKKLNLLCQSATNHPNFNAMLAKALAHHGVELLQDTTSEDDIKLNLEL